MVDRFDNSIFRTTASTASLNASRGRLNSTNGPVNDVLNHTLPGRIPVSVAGESGVDDEENDTDILLPGDAYNAAATAGASGPAGDGQSDGGHVAATAAAEMDTVGDDEVEDILAQHGFYDGGDQSSSSQM